MDCEFKDSGEATEFMEELTSMLNDERLLDWAEETDTNYSTNTVQSLAYAILYYEGFMHEMYAADEK